MQEPYIKNVGKGTWSQYFGLDNTATKRAAEQDKNALNREVDQQLKAIKRTRENTENTNTSISPHRHRNFKPRNSNVVI